MLKKGFNSVFSLFMAFLVLFSTVSFTVEKHYCGDVLIDAAVFSEPQFCGMETASFAEKQCCKEELEIVKGQDKLKLSKFEEASLSHQTLPADSSFTKFNLFDFSDERIILYKYYAPPNLVTDIQLLDQVFII